MSGPAESLQERRAKLAMRAAADREAISRQLQPFATLGGTLEKLSGQKHDYPGMSLGLGLGLSALLVAFPGSQAPIIRGGIALFRLANSVRTLFKHR